jgi:hypothetical protein
MIGMSLNSGICHTGRCGGELNLSASCDMTAENRYPVRPETSTLSTTPTITWLTRYLMPNTASAMETRAPAMAAEIRPM